MTAESEEKTHREKTKNKMNKQLDLPFEWVFTFNHENATHFMRTSLTCSRGSIGHMASIHTAINTWTIYTK